MSNPVRLFPRLGNAPVYAYRDEILKPIATPADIESDTRRLMVLTDIDTGTDVAWFAWEPYQAPQKLDWADVSRRFFAHVASSGEYRPVEMRVLMHIFSVAGFGNAVSIPGAEIARVLGLHRSQVSKALTVLVARGALVRVRDENARRTRVVNAYRLNANLGAVSGERLGRPQWMKDAHDRFEADAQDAEDAAVESSA
jgi:hypothetical protein